MDWIVKASAWDVAELGEEDSSLFSSLTGSNTLVDGKNGSTLLNDMGLGRLGDLQDGVMDKSKEQKGLSSLPLPSELKKTHALSCTKKVSCLVDGCLSDLSKCREYHRRHRVCELHSKTPIVIIRGREQRFCQQCSRFHSLGEFDDVKRSCRKRLDGHNRRRRKPQPESLYMSSQSFLSEYRGGSWLQFSMPQTYESNGGISQQTYESNGGISISWPDNNNHNQGLHSGLKKTSSATDKEFSILTDTNSEKGIYQSPEVAISAKLVNPSANSISDRSHLTISDHKVTHLEESRCALSLLSTTQIQAVRTTLNPLPVEHDIIHLSQPTCTNLQYNELYPYSYPRVMDDKSVGAVATPGGSNIFDCVNDGISPLFQRAV